jgi:hypothetical protein
MGRVALLTTLLSLGLVAGCHRPKGYETQVQITRVTAAIRDENGRALATDVELSYPDCPGTQVEVVRGGEQFSSCVSKLAVGTKVPAHVERTWDPEGHYRWDVLQVADCKRPPDPNDDESFATVRECEDWKVNGATVGFQCQLSPKKELLAKCPWFARH